MTILIDALLKSTLLLTVAWTAAACLKRAPAAARHLVWFAAFAAIAALPLLTGALPAISVAVPDAVGLTGAPLFRAGVTGAASASPSLGSASPAAAAAPATPAALSLDWRKLLPLAWGAGAALMLLHLTAGYLRMAWLRRKARPIDRPEALAELAGAARALGVRTPVALLESDAAGVPMACGVLRPAICLPPSAQEWDAQRLRVVLLHEMAHVLRRDPLTHLATRLVVCLYWLHPLAWLALREFLRERERASDDLVLAAGARPSDYAGHLLGVAASMGPAPAGWAPVCMARPSQLEGRLIAILDARTRRGAARPTLAAVAAFAAVLLAAPLASLSLRAAEAPPVNAAEMDALIRAGLSARDHAMIERTLRTLLEAHRWKEASQLADVALRIRGERYGADSQEYATGLVQQGEARRAAGQWREAEDSYTQAAALQKNSDPATLEFFARTALSQRQFEKAASICEQALGLQPTDALRARLLISLAYAREQLADVASAERHYLEATRSAQPDSTDMATALELYGRMLAANGRGEEAQPLATRAREIRFARISQGNTPAPVVSGPAYRVGAGVTPPRLSYKVEPAYSEEARTTKYQGTVALYAEVGIDGLAHNLRVVRPLGLGLDEKAVEAVRQWRFIPGTKDGAPVTVAATIEVNFRLY